VNLFRENVCPESVRALRVPKALAGQCIEELRRADALDAEWRPRPDGSVLLVPIREETAAFHVESFGAAIGDAPFDRTPRPVRPFDAIGQAARAAGLKASVLPRRWERIGDVVLLRPPRNKHLAGGRGSSHRCSVRLGVARAHGRRGPRLDPGPMARSSRSMVVGDGTRTVHREDGVLFALDVSEVMFSSGNLAERMRMARLPQPGETVVDLFAGIGYFSIPMAVKSRAARIVACEVNPSAFEYLRENVRLNRVDCVETRLGDCRDVAPTGVADRIVMGHFGAGNCLDAALRAARPTATIHVHGLGRLSRASSRSLAGEADNLVTHIDREARRQGFRVASVHRHVIKSYGPGVRHFVVDAVVRR